MTRGWPRCSTAGPAAAKGGPSARKRLCGFKIRVALPHEASTSNQGFRNTLLRRIKMARTVHLFVFDTLADWEPGYAVAGINNPEYQTQPGRYRVQTVGIGGMVTTIGGITIVPDTKLADLDPAESAMLILPGGNVWDGDGIPAAVEKAREFLAAGVPVAAICGATAGLARGGLLDAAAHTSNAAGYLQATGYGGAARYRADPAVTDGS